MKTRKLTKQMVVGAIGVSTLSLAATLASAMAAEKGAPILLGQYKVSDVLQKTKTGWQSRCSSETLDSQGNAIVPDPACHQVFLAVKSESELAFVQPDRQVGSSLLNAFLFFPSLLNAQCGYSARVEPGSYAELFGQSLCRATRAPKLDASGFQSYFYSPGMHPETDNIANAIVTFSMTGIPVGFSSAYETRLPTGSASPDQFEVHALLRGSVLFIPAKVEYRYLMVRSNPSNP